MKVYSMSRECVVRDYIGCWYDGQCQPQTVYLTIQGNNGKAYIDCDYEIGNSCPADVFNGIDIRFPLNEYVYSKGECESMLEELEPLIKNLYESHEEYNDGCNWRGKWDEFDIEELEIAIYDLESSDLCFDEEGQYADDAENEIE